MMPSRDLPAEPSGLRVGLGALKWSFRLLLALIVMGVPRSYGASGTVPDDFATIQGALDQAGPGDLIQVKDSPGSYFEKIEFVNGGSAALGFVRLEAFPGHVPVLDGNGVPGSNMVLMDSKSYVRIYGFVIRNNLGVADGSGIRVIGSGSHIEIQGNTIHDIRGTDAMGITVYGTSPAVSISNLVIDGNVIYDCEPAHSEALTLNGNVENFVVANNLIRDVNNIGIDFIGGETDINPDPAKVARNGVCRFNQVYRANSDYEGGYAAGIYVDGGRDIIIENNIVSGCDLGIEIGAENRGSDAAGMVVRNNIVFRNEKVGIVFGGYDASVGRTRDCSFLGNTCIMNDTLGEGLGELWIQYAGNNVIRNNIFYSTNQNVLLYSEDGNVNNTLDYNLWYAPGGTNRAEFTWQGTSYGSFDEYLTGTGQGANSLFSDPLLRDGPNDDFHLTDSSPAVDRGEPGFVPGADEVDMDGQERVSGGRVDMGADELAPSACTADAVVDPSSQEACPGDSLRFDGTGSSVSNCVGGEADYTWLLDGFELPGEDSPVLSLPAPSASGAVSLMVACSTDSRCSDIVDVPVAVFPPPAEPLVEPVDPEMCPGESIDLTLTNSGDYASFEWTTDPPGLPGDHATTPIVTGRDVGARYMVTVRSAEGCTAQAAVTIRALPDSVPPSLGNFLTLTKPGVNDIELQWADLTVPVSDYRIPVLEGDADRDGMRDAVPDAGHLEAAPFFTVAPGAQTYTDTDGITRESFVVFYKIRATSLCTQTPGPF